MCSSVSWCFNRGEFSKKFDKILSEEDTRLTETSKNILRNRYVCLVNKLEVSSKRSSFLYHSFSSIITVGSILVPALISIQDRTFTNSQEEEEKADHENRIYWSTWGVSLSVTLSNAMIRLFGLDKTYITRKLRSNKLTSEGWLFLELSGDYSDFSSHQDAFSYFCDKIETIKTEQIREEYTFDNNFSTNNIIRQRGVNIVDNTDV
jgi:hypothetical protein